MAILNKLLDGFVQVIKWLLMLAVFCMSALILVELLIRNLFNESFSPTIEICSILFIWLAFCGVIYLYHHSSLMRFEILLSRVGPKTSLVFWFFNKAASLLLGVIMVVAYIEWRPFLVTRYFATMQFLPYTVQCVPIAICGAYMAIKTICQLVEKGMELAREKKEVASC